MSAPSPSRTTISIYVDVIASLKPEQMPIHEYGVVTFVHSTRWSRLSALVQPLSPACTILKFIHPIFGHEKTENPDETIRRCRDNTYKLHDILHDNLVRCVRVSLRACKSHKSRQELKYINYYETNATRYHLAFFKHFHSWNGNRKRPSSIPWALSHVPSLALAHNGTILAFIWLSVVYGNCMAAHRHRQLSLASLPPSPWHSDLSIVTFMNFVFNSFPLSLSLPFSFGLVRSHYYFG